MQLLSITAMADAIRQTHLLAMALQVTSPAEPEFTRDEPVYRAAKTAAVALGFIAIDAECVAQAWYKQVLRIGAFDATQWPSEPEDFGLPTWPRGQAFAPCPQRLGLYAVLPDAAWVARMAQAGVPTLQLRFKSDDTQAVAAQVQASVAAVKGTSSLLFINDHWQAAIEARAYGVHLGQEDLDSADLKAIHRAGLRLGLSSHGYAEMVKADRVSPSYIAMGAVFPTTLKRMATAPQGVGRLHHYARLMRHIPQVAIGGIDAASLDAVLATGVGSVAVVRAITASDKPEQVASEWMEKINFR